jgi:hypothetical protein
MKRRFREKGQYSNHRMPLSGRFQKKFRDTYRIIDGKANLQKTNGNLSYGSMKDELSMEEIDRQLTSLCSDGLGGTNDVLEDMICDYGSTCTGGSACNFFYGLRDDEWTANVRHSESVKEISLDSQQHESLTETNKLLRLHAILVKMADLAEVYYLQNRFEFLQAKKSQDLTLKNSASET